MMHGQQNVKKKIIKHACYTLQTDRQTKAGDVVKGPKFIIIILLLLLLNGKQISSCVYVWVL